MEKLDSLKIGPGQRTLELWHGDLTEMAADQAVDILVVSAMPGSYLPIPHTLIEALEKKGISLRQMAQDKLVDLRETCSCWLSKPIDSAAPGIQFKQILCFEPKRGERPEELVGDIFRSLVPFVCSHSSLKNVAMPLVSAGSVHRDPINMMDALFQAAVHWLEHGLPVERLMIVEKDRDKALMNKGAFGILRKHYTVSQNPPPSPKYDVFISYSHQNSDQMRLIADELHRLKPGIRLFIDKLELKPGMAWQEMLYRSIDNARKVLVLYSPPYLSSKACQEEYNIAHVLHRTRREVLFPIFLYTADLPPYMSDWQYMDCREADDARLREACQCLIDTL